MSGAAWDPEGTAGTTAAAWKLQVCFLAGHKPGEMGNAQLLAGGAKFLGTDKC